MEELSHTSIAGGFRMSKAVNTYYVIYHLFCFLMLLDKDYFIKAKGLECLNGYADINIDINKLNDKSELPDVWNDAKKYEQDISTMISHSDIKNYCEKMRQNPPVEYSEYFILYNNFIYADLDNPNKSREGLEEPRGRFEWHLVQLLL